VRVARRAIRAGRLESRDPMNVSMYSRSNRRTRGVNGRHIIGLLSALLRRVFNFANLSRDTMRHLLREMSTDSTTGFSRGTKDLLRSVARTSQRAAWLAACPITSVRQIPETELRCRDRLPAQDRDVEKISAEVRFRRVFRSGRIPWQIRASSPRAGLCCWSLPPPGFRHLPFWIRTRRTFVGASLDQWELKRRHRADQSRRRHASAIAFSAIDCMLDGKCRASGRVLRASWLGGSGAVPDERTIRHLNDSSMDSADANASPRLRFGPLSPRTRPRESAMKLCQTFDFGNFQASAIDDGCRSSLNARHSFPPRRAEASRIVR